MFNRGISILQSFTALAASKVVICQEGLVNQEAKYRQA